MKHPDNNKTIDMMDKTFSQLDSGIKGMEAESKRGRKPLPAVEPVTDVVDAEALVRAGQAATDLTVIQSAMTAEQVRFSQRIGERIGRQRAADLLQKVVTVTDLIELQEIKNSKVYRGMSLLDASGKVVTVTTWAEFCQISEGRSVEQVDEDIRNLRAFGASFMEEMQRIGLGYRQMRELRQIPEAERVELLEKTGIDELTEDVIADLIDKHKAEKKKREDAELQLEASRKLVGDYAGQVTDLKEKLARPYKAKPGAIAQTEKEEAALKELNAVFTDAHAISLRLANVVNQVLDDYDDRPIADHARACIDHMARALAQLARTHGIDVRQTMNDELDMAAWTESMLGPDIAGKLKKSAG